MVELPNCRELKLVSLSFDGQTIEIVVDDDFNDEIRYVVRISKPSTFVLFNYTGDLSINRLGFDVVPTSSLLSVDHNGFFIQPTDYVQFMKAAKIGGTAAIGRKHADASTLIILAGSTIYYSIIIGVQSIIDLESVPL